MSGSGKLVLDGRSGCEVEIVKTPEITLVRKSSMSEHYNDRLILQAKKQGSFTPRLIFAAPNVFAQNSIGGAYFEMEYVPGEKYSDYLTRISKQDLDYLIQNFIKYFDQNITQSQFVACNPDLFIRKAEQIRNTLLNKNELDDCVNQIIDNLINYIPNYSIPLGYCHGDFTFSNMIFFDKKVFLVDFLDSFIDSPLIDIVKLRQDTCYKWTLLIDKTTDIYKKGKVWQIMNYIDKCILEHFEPNPYFYIWYNYLQKFNLIRILPYISNYDEKDLIVKSLKTL